MDSGFTNTLIGLTRAKDAFFRTFAITKSLGREPKAIQAYPGGNYAFKQFDEPFIDTSGRERFKERKRHSNSATDSARRNGTKTGCGMPVH